ncbi:Tubulin-tyrosine ligase family protein [Trichomonas vaginalis G3]|uniref:Tubulin--tyrosine ligase-like protein 5 n=1 Tax=Trichomonas vaginalis (strain ATCC PRA-98 / G3) TaxID=412133 RepID=A2G0H2_TRIV3|nr:protein polyglutamylation [Trichomonas vaginalis G3]EAX89347.1 Tubulin-tyrosine ligase family protein [Trichomonas vaginalis G3]KAI5553675.1 protein polyglutamylation [Trichomonas vaginalis G3]|eukprot:XP_001302277.1 Tubulin-tyrosine ligase family protein [Trichomonas vaginalis G3]
MEKVKRLLNEFPLPFSCISMPKSDGHARLNENNQRFCPYYVASDLQFECLKKCGFIPTMSTTNTNIIAGRLLNEESFKALKPWQKVNHFFSVDLIGRKDEFHQRMLELRDRIGNDETQFYQESYLLPDDFEKIMTAWSTSPMWILKPRASSKGQNIEIRDSKEQSYPPYPYLVQKYLDRPFLILRRKFDIRFYTLVTGVEPLRIYIHRHGLGLFCTTKYDKSAGVKDPRMHITNWEVNKDSKAFVRAHGIEETEEDSKWSLPFFFNWLSKNGYNSDEIKKHMEYAAVKATIAGMDKVRESHIKVIKDRHQSFELLGIDMLLDENLNPYVVEINVSPGMSGTDSELDKWMKTEVLMDTYNMAKIVDCDPYKECKDVERIHEIERNSVSKKRRENVEKGSVNPWDDPVFMDVEIVREYVDELERCRGYHCVYPLKENVLKYKNCFSKNIYEDIVLRNWVLMNDTEKEAAMGRALVSYNHFLNETTQSNYCSIC